MIWADCAQVSLLYRPRIRLEEPGLYLHLGCADFGARAFWCDWVDAWYSEATMSRDCSTNGGLGSCCSV